MYVSARGQKTSVVKKVVSLLKTDNDSAYVEDYTTDFTTRLYVSRKYTYYNLANRQKENLRYRPNTNINPGLGFSYRFLTVNLGFKLPAFNNDDDKYGKTKVLDLQAYLYLRKLIIGFYGQSHKGYYVSGPDGWPKGFASGKPITMRPDLRTMDLGLDVQYVFNDKRFSYRAAYLQNEIQKKSAGSFLAGGEVFAFKVDGDSAIIPLNMVKPDFFNGENFYRSTVLSAAANVGYAHTFVYKEHFFLLLSLTGGAGINYTSMFQENGRIIREGGWQLNNMVRIALGYNSNRYFAGIHYVDMITRSETPLNGSYQQFGTGNLRVSVARRFNTNNKKALLLF